MVLCRVDSYYDVEPCLPPSYHEPFRDLIHWKGLVKVYMYMAHLDPVPVFVDENKDAEKKISHKIPAAETLPFSGPSIHVKISYIFSKP